MPELDTEALSREFRAGSTDFNERVIKKWDILYWKEGTLIFIHMLFKIYVLFYVAKWYFFY